MSYIIYRIDGDGKVLEETATLDFARLRAKKLSLKVNDWLVIFDKERYERKVRSFAFFGRVYWSKTCETCRGEGTGCLPCYGTGGVVDYDTW